MKEGKSFRIGVMGASLSALVCFTPLVVLMGKFGLGLDAMTYSGIALLVLASVWNVWPLSKLDDVAGSLDERNGVAL